MTTTVHIAYDDVSLGLIPADASVVCVYMDGRYKNDAAARTRFPHAMLIPITVRGAPGARYCDCESGDLTPAQAAQWAANELQADRKPGIYSSVSEMPVVMQALAAHFIQRDQVLLWSAHFTGVEHICGPHSCAFPGMKWVADGTQFTDRALGRSLDESLVTNAFLGLAPTPPAPKPVAHGHANVALSVDLQTNTWADYHIPGTAHWGADEKSVSAKVRLCTGGKHAGEWTVTPLFPPRPHPGP